MERLKFVPPDNRISTLFFQNSVEALVDSDNQAAHGSIVIEANPRLIEVRENDWPIKAFYSLMRLVKEGGYLSVPIIDIASSVEVEKDELEIVKSAIDEGYRESLSLGHYTEYPSSWGLFRLRQAVANFFKDRTGTLFDPKKEVMVTGGIIKAVDTVIQSLDITHVIIPSFAPYFVRSLTILRGKGIIEVPLDLRTGNFDLVALEKTLVEQKAPMDNALMYMTIPSAPAGTLPQEEFIEHELIPFARKHNVPIISDTYVLATTFSDQPIRPLMSYPGAREVAVEAVGVAKELGLPGLRIGGVVGNPEIINAMRLFAASSLEMLPNANQNIAAIALEKIEPEPVGVRLVKILTEEILPRFEQMKWPIIVPKAGLDMLVEIPKAYKAVESGDHSLLTSLSFLFQYGIAFSPASVFGTEGDQYLRIVLKQADHKISKALDRLIDMDFDWETAEPDSEVIAKCKSLIQKLDLTRL